MCKYAKVLEHLFQLTPTLSHSSFPPNGTKLIIPQNQMFLCCLWRAEGWEVTPLLPWRPWRGSNSWCLFIFTSITGCQRIISFWHRDGSFSPSGSCRSSRDFFCWFLASQVHCASSLGCWCRLLGRASVCEASLSWLSDTHRKSFGAPSLLRYWG